MNPDKVKDIHDRLDAETIRAIEENDQIDGTLADMSLAEAQRQQASKQSSLDEFSGEGELTYVGIVNHPTDEFLRCVDEIEPRIAPPDKLFYQWLDRKDSLGHNEAYEAVDYDERYSKYLWFNDVAESGLIEMANRIADGENIVYVCYCTGGQMCHRKQATYDTRKWLDVLASVSNADEAEMTRLEDFE